MYDIISLAVVYIYITTDGMIKLPRYHTSVRVGHCIDREKLRPGGGVGLAEPRAASDVL